MTWVNLSCVTPARRQIHPWTATQSHPSSVQYLCVLYISLLLSNNRFLYVAMSMEQQLRVFQVEKDYKLAHVQSVSINTFPDNLHLSQDGRQLYVGAHPIVHLALDHIADPNKPAPSQVNPFSHNLTLRNVAI